MQTENHANVKGFIAMPRGEGSARIKVLAFKRGGTYIYNENEIKNEFPSDGYIFAPNLLAGEDYKVGDLLEFSTLPIESPNGPDRIRLDPRIFPNNAGIEVFRIDHVILDNPLAFDQPRLKMFISEAAGNFYIQNYSIVYGPFKLVGGDVMPTTDTKVQRFDKSPPIITIGQKLYLLEKPMETGVRIDCSKPSELTSWFKKQLKTLTLPIKEIQQLFQQLEQLENTDLDNAKLERVLKLTKNVLLTRDELQELSETSTILKEIFTSSFQQLREGLRNEEVVPFEKEQKKLKIECDQLIRTAKKLRGDIESVTTQKNILLNEVDFLENNKARLINDIKVNTAVTGKFSSNGVTSKVLLTYEIQTYSKTDQPFKDLAEFITCYKRLFFNGENESKESKRSLFQLRDKRAILCTNPLFIRLIAMHSNNCKLYVQQVEADWLKFESLYDNGLKQCWESALDQPDVIHFLLLEDINIAAIECYARPITDLIMGVRDTLPGLQSSWPKNLWIFGIPIEKDDGTELGIPLFTRSFRGWGALPAITSIKNELEKDQRHLTVEALFSHDFDYDVPLNDYFS